MNTDQDEIYGTLLTIGSIGGQIEQLLAALDEREISASVIDHLRSNLLRDRTIIEKLGTAEQSIRDIRAMVDQWTADAKARINPDHRQ